MTTTFIASRNAFLFSEPSSEWPDEGHLASATPEYHPLVMHSSYPAWLKLLAVLTVGTLLCGFILGAIWPQSWVTIGVPIGFTLWWIVAKTAERSRRVHDAR